MQTANHRQKWLRLLVVLAGFAVLAVTVELAGAPRGLLLPIWTGVVLALAARSPKSRYLPRFSKGARS